jgi:hypothetical protein
LVDWPETTRICDAGTSRNLASSCIMRWLALPCSGGGATRTFHSLPSQPQIWSFEAFGTALIGNFDSCMFKENGLRKAYLQALELRLVENRAIIHANC